MNLIHFVASTPMEVSKSISLLEQIKCSSNEEILFSLTVKMKLLKSILSSEEMDRFQEMFQHVAPANQQMVEQILLGAKVVDFWRFMMPRKPFPNILQQLISSSKDTINVKHCKCVFGPFEARIPFYQHSQNVIPSAKCLFNCPCKKIQEVTPFDDYCEKKQITFISILILDINYNDQILCGAHNMIPKIQCIVLLEKMEIEGRLLYSVLNDKIQAGYNEKAIYYLSVLPSFRFFT